MKIYERKMAYSVGIIQMPTDCATVKIQSKIAGVKSGI